MKVAVLGATGFTGEKLIELLVRHPRAEIAYLAAKIEKPCIFSTLFPRFKGTVDVPCELPQMSRAVKKADIFFLAVPHTVSMGIAPVLLKHGKRVIDLSADYRLKNVGVYEKYYAHKHRDKKNVKKATYGLVEFFKRDIKKSTLVANPGCYPVSTILPLAPLLREKLIEPRVYVDAKSSVTGAGRRAALDFHYSNIANNIWAYKPFVHQHTPEIRQTLKAIAKRNVELFFVPHVMGVEAGIHSTLYVCFKKKVKKDTLRAVYDAYYRDAAFVRIRQGLPRLKEVVGTNFCDIGFVVGPGDKHAVITSCIDNLIKGASGNAIHNMNVMCGFAETEGLL